MNDPVRSRSKSAGLKDLSLLVMGVFQLLLTVQLTLPDFDEWGPRWTNRKWRSEAMSALLILMPIMKMHKKTGCSLSVLWETRICLIKLLLNYFLVVFPVFVGTCPPSDQLSDTNTSSKRVTFWLFLFFKNCHWVLFSYRHFWEGELFSLTWKFSVPEKTEQRGQSHIPSLQGPRYAISHLWKKKPTTLQFGFKKIWMIQFSKGLCQQRKYFPLFTSKRLTV